MILYACCDRENSAWTDGQRKRVGGWKPSASGALGSPGSSGQSPAGGARYRVESAIPGIECGWYHGSDAFVPVRDGGLFFLSGPAPSTARVKTEYPSVRLCRTAPPCGARKTLRAYAVPCVFRPLRKFRLCFICHRQRKAAIPLRQGSPKGKRTPPPQCEHWGTSP